MTEVKIGEVYCHVKSGKLYRVIDEVPIKYGGDWDRCVIYSPLVIDEGSTTFVRLTDEFVQKFIITNFCEVMKGKGVKS